MISEAKKKIVIDNYFKGDCNINTTIKEAYTKGFERGLSKAPKQRTGKWLDTIQDGWWQCSNCGVYWQKTIVESCNIVYCPNCGVKMGK